MNTNLPEVKEIALAAFPNYTGRKFQVRPFSPMSLQSSWQGGSRSYYVILNLETLRHEPIQENGTSFSNGGQILRISDLPANGAVIEHSIFCGKDMGINIYVNPENLAKMLPAIPELTIEERIVLSATRGLKSSYNGIKNYRFHEAQQTTGITWNQWAAAQDSLLAKGLILKTGAITNEGRNAIGNTQLYTFKSAINNA